MTSEWSTSRIMDASTRYHGLDALRSVAMLLGIVLHACQLFIAPEFIPQVNPAATKTVEESSLGTDLLVIWIHNWRMPQFFILAGFFGAMVIERRGGRAFLGDRALRILGALLVFHLIFALTLGRPWGRIDHMWFLWFLFLASGVALILRWALRDMHLKPLEWCLGTLPRMALLIVPVALLGLIGRNGPWHKIPFYIYTPEFGGFLLYFGFFVIGQALWTQRQRIEELAQRWVWVWLLGMGTLLLPVLGYLIEMRIPTEYLQIVVAISTLVWSFGLIGLTHALVRRASAGLTWLVGIAYPVYLIHLFPTLYLSALSIEAGWSEGLSIPLVSLAGFGVSVAASYVLVKFTPLDWVVSGPKKAWLKPPWLTEKTHPN